MDGESIVWNDSYSVGYELMDEQHKELVKMINTLLLGSKMGSTASDIVFMKTLRSAIDYAKSHFSIEEKLLKQVNYPDLPLQKEQHELFITRILDAADEFEQGKSEPLALASFLKNWLLSHIAEMDKRYSSYITRLK